MIEPENIVIIRTDRIGDVVLSLPMVDLIKKKYPDCRISFLVREYTKSLLEGNKSIDEIIVLKEKNRKIDFFGNLKTLKSRNFDSAILVSPTFRKALLLFLSGIKNRVGTGYRWYSFLFSKKINEHRKYGDKHELQLNVNMLKVFGIEEILRESDVHFNIHVDESAKQKIDNIFSQKGIDPQKPVVILHPGSGGSAIDLPLEKMRQLAAKLAQSLAYNVIVTGSKEEKDLCEKMTVDKNIFNFAGLFNLKELIALIDRCSLMAANSTGPIHITAALGKHVIGFYPKIDSCSPKRWGPFTEKKDIFTPELNCSNCTRKQCENLNCMNSINIDKVFKAIQNALIK